MEAAYPTTNEPAISTPIESTTSESETSTTLPKQFTNFLHANNISPSIYSTTRTLPRYVRILRYRDRLQEEIEDMIEKISADAECLVRQIPDVPGFLSIADQKIKLSQLRSYKSGDIVGIDVSSGIAVMALGVQPGDNVLDLCCAPGAKLIFIAELLHSNLCESIGTVTGVDISMHRAGTCRSIIKRYSGNTKAQIRLYVEDGTLFDCKAPADRWWDPSVLKAYNKNSNHKKKNKTSGRKRRRTAGTGCYPWFAPKLMSSPYACEESQELYDRVLVDAECTHDGSLVHVMKYEQWGWDKLEDRVVGNDRPDTVPVLQSKLLENGWRLLRPGGILVYSTCSLSIYQNEAVIGGFLKRHPETEVKVEPISILGDDSDDQNKIRLSPAWTPSLDTNQNNNSKIFDRMKGAVRLDPAVSNTSGMFIARLKKLKDRIDESTPTAAIDDIIPMEVKKLL